MSVAEPLTPPVAGAVIVIRNAYRRFSMGTTVIRALNGVNLTVQSGEFLALMGASGSGKSTLLNVLGCLDYLNEGQYWLEGQPISHSSSDRLARIRNERIGIVFQNFNLLPRLTAWQNVALPLMYRRSKEDMRKRAYQVLEQVGLTQRAQQFPMLLSGGERQRVAIARALVTAPAILLADEPTGNLDSATGKELMQLLAGLSSQGHTILIVTHDPNVAAYAGRRLRMQDGHLYEEGTHDRS